MYVWVSGHTEQQMCHEVSGWQTDRYAGNQTQQEERAFWWPVFLFICGCVCVFCCIIKLSGTWQKQRGQNYCLLTDESILLQNIHSHTLIQWGERLVLDRQTSEGCVLHATSVLFFFHSLHICFCHFSYVPPTASPWMPSGRECRKLCTIILICMIHCVVPLCAMVDFSLCLRVWPFRTGINTFASRRGQKRLVCFMYTPAWQPHGENKTLGSHCTRPRNNPAHNPP